MKFASQVRASSHRSGGHHVTLHLPGRLRRGGNITKEVEADICRVNGICIKLMEPLTILQQQNFKCLASLHLWIHYSLVLSGMNYAFAHPLISKVTSWQCFLTVLILAYTCGAHSHSFMYYAHFFPLVPTKRLIAFFVWPPPFLFLPAPLRPSPRGFKPKKKKKEKHFNPP